MSSGSTELNSQIDALYALPLEQFVAQRKVLANRLKSEGDGEAAQRVGRLIKPSVAAWATNRVVLAHGEAFASFLEGAESVRRSHGDDPSSLQAAIRARRAALDRIVGLAESELKEHGRSPSKSLLSQVARTFDALSAGGEEGVVAGRLTEALEAPGFAALAGFSLAPPMPPSSDQSRSSDNPGGREASLRDADCPSDSSVRAARAGPRAQEAEEREEARRRLQEANAAIRVAEAEEARARRGRERAERTAKRLERLLEEARLRLETLQGEAAEANAALTVAALEEVRADEALEWARQRMREGP